VNDYIQNVWHEYLHRDRVNLYLKRAIRESNYLTLLIDVRKSIASEQVFVCGIK
jgi:hypothetical protein